MVAERPAHRASRLGLGIGGFLLALPTLAVYGLLLMIAVDPYFSPYSEVSKDLPRLLALAAVTVAALITGLLVLSASTTGRRKGSAAAGLLLCAAALLYQGLAFA